MVSGCSLLTLARKTIKWLLLLTLPVTFFPLFGGGLGGVYWAFWNGNHVWQGTDKWLHEVRHRQEDWSVGADVMSFQDFQDQPGTITNNFGVLRVNSWDWARKLGFILPDQYSNPDMIEELNTPIDKLADLTKLMRDTTDSSAMEKRREQWIWISEYGWPIMNPWDAAYVTATLYAQGENNLNKTSLYVAESEHNAGFICNVWSTRAPALIHFLVEDEYVDPARIEEGLTYSADLRTLRPVTARIIEFPLEGAYTGLPENVFPGHEEQVLAIMTGNRLYEQFEPHDSMEQMMKRFNEVMDKVGAKKGKLLWYVWEADRWVTENINKPLGIEDAMTFLHTLTFILVGNGLQVFVFDPIRTVKEIFDEFTARPKRGDWVMGGSGGESAKQPNLDTWMKNLIESLSSQSVLKSVTATADGGEASAPTETP